MDLNSEKIEDFSLKGIDILQSIRALLATREVRQRIIAALMDFGLVFC